MPSPREMCFKVKFEREHHTHIPHCWGVFPLWIFSTAISSFPSRYPLSFACIFHLHRTISFSSWSLHSILIYISFGAVTSVFYFKPCFFFTRPWKSFMKWVKVCLKYNSIDLASVLPMTSIHILAEVSLANTGIMRRNLKGNAHAWILPSEILMWLT